MRNVVCDSENHYDLALGPQILGGLADIYMTILPSDVVDKIEEFAKLKGVPSMEYITKEDKMQELEDANVLTIEDHVRLTSSLKQQAPIELVRNTVRKMNGVRISNLDYWEDEKLTELNDEEKMNVFLEEIVDDDFQEIVNEINAAVFKFQTGLDISEKSKVFSQLKEQENTSSPMLQESSS